MALYNVDSKWLFKVSIYKKEKHSTKRMCVCVYIGGYFYNFGMVEVFLRITQRQKHKRKHRYDLFFYVKLKFLIY